MKSDGKVSEVLLDIDDIPCFGLLSSVWLQQNDVLKLSVEFFNVFSA